MCVVRCMRNRRRKTNTTRPFIRNEREGEREEHTNKKKQSMAPHGTHASRDVSAPVTWCVSTRHVVCQHTSRQVMSGHVMCQHASRGDQHTSRQVMSGHVTCQHASRGMSARVTWCVSTRHVMCQHASRGVSAHVMSRQVLCHVITVLYCAYRT